METGNVDIIVIIQLRLWHCRILHLSIYYCDCLPARTALFYGHKQDDDDGGGGSNEQPEKYCYKNKYQSKLLYHFSPKPRLTIYACDLCHVPCPDSQSGCEFQDD